MKWAVWKKIPDWSHYAKIDDQYTKSLQAGSGPLTLKLCIKKIQPIKNEVFFFFLKLYELTPEIDHKKFQLYLLAFRVCVVGVVSYGLRCMMIFFCLW